MPPPWRASRPTSTRCSACLDSFAFEAELRKVISAKAQQDCPGEVRGRILALLDRLDQGDDEGAAGADPAPV